MVCIYFTNCCCWHIKKTPTEPHKNRHCTHLHAIQKRVNKKRRMKQQANTTTLSIECWAQRQRWIDPMLDGAKNAIKVQNHQQTLILNHLFLRFQFEEQRFSNGMSHLYVLCFCSGLFMLLPMIRSTEVYSFQNHKVPWKNMFSTLPTFCVRFQCAEVSSNLLLRVTSFFNCSPLIRMSHVDERLKWFLLTSRK